MTNWACRWQPLSSIRPCFQTLPSWTLISRPSIKSWLIGGCSFAKLPGRSSAKIPPKSLDSNQIRERAGTVLCATHPFTFSHVIFKASRLYRSSSSIVCSISSLSLHRSQHLFQARLSLLDPMLRDSNQREYLVGQPTSSTHVSIMFMTLGFTFFVPRCCSSRSRALSLSWSMSSLLKSYTDPAWPNRLL